MPDTLRQIALIKIVRADAYLDQLVDKLFHRVRAIVNARHQHGLCAERNARIGQLRRGLAHLWRKFFRVIDVNVHPDWMILANRRQHRVRNPLGQKDRNTCPEADDLNRFNCAESGENIVQHFVGEEQTVSARNENIANLWVSFKILGNRLHAALVSWHHPGTDHSASGAVATIRHALIGYVHEDTVGITMHKPRNRHVGVLAKRVFQIRIV